MGNKLNILSTIFILGFLLISCSVPTPATSPDVQPQAPVTLEQPLDASKQAQQLPISAVATIPNGTKIKLEVALTPQQQAMGLMYRPTLPDDRGMLFQFKSAKRVNFWMKNVPVPLDMIFMRKGVIEYVAESVPPCLFEPCPTYGPNVPVDQVIELRSGRAAELNLSAGQRVKIDFLNSVQEQRQR